MRARSEHQPAHLTPPDAGRARNDQVLSVLLDTTHDGVVVLDDTRAIRLNAAAERLLGAGAASVPPLEWPERLGCFRPDAMTPYPPDEFPLVRALAGECVDDDLVCILGRSDQKRRWLRISAHPLPGADGEPRGAVAILRDVTEQQVADRRMSVQQAVARIMAETACMSDAMPRILQAICEDLDWRAGVAWLPDAGAGVLRCEHVWSAPDPGAQRFGEVTRQTTLARGEGCPGRVWASGEAICLDDLAGGRGDPRSAAARESGLGSTLAVPVRWNGAVIGVLEFVGGPREYSHEELLGMLSTIGDQVGQYTGRGQAEEALEHSLSILEATLESTGDGILVVDNDAKILSFNSRFVDIWSIPEEVLATRDDEKALACAMTRLRDPEAFLARVRELYESPDVEQVDVLELKNGKVLERSSRPRWVGDRREGRVWSFHDITERRRVEERLRESEKKYRNLVETSKDVVWSVDSKGRFTFLNQAVRTIYGYEPSELLGRHFGILVSPERLETAVANLQRMIQGEGSFQHEAEHRRKDGKQIFLSFNLIPLRDDQGHVIGATGTATDMTERKRIEEMLAETASQERQLREAFARLLEISNHLAMCATHDELCRRAVELGREKLGIDRLSVWFLNDDRASIRGSFGTDEQGRTRDERGNSVPIQTATRTLLETGRLRSAALTERMLCDDRGQTVGQGSHVLAPMWDGRSFVGFMYADNLITRRRITERDAEILTLYAATVGHLCSRQRAEESLRQSEEKYKNLVETTNTGYLIIDQQFRVVDANPEYVRLSGHQELGEIFGRNVLEWIPPADRQRNRELLERCVREGFVRNLEVEYQRENGPVTPVEINATVIETPQGRLILALCRNITERRRLQRQLLQSQKLESIGTLAGGIAHDFNNLLAVVLGNASIHHRDRTLPVKVRESLSDIITAAERGSSLTHQLLVYARGGLQQPTAIQLNGLVAPVVQMLRRTAPPQIDFVLQLEKHLPPIIADPSQIEQVVMNLCLNAMQASQAPSSISITTTEDVVDAARASAIELREGRYACLKVTDHGCGMDRVTIERMFEPFFTTKFTGRGMGLSACQGIVQSHQGQIRAESEPGRGTTMSVWLPLAPEWRKVRGQPSSRRQMVAAQGTETILVIDDEPAITRTVEQILSSLGYCVVSHHDPDAAMTFLSSNAEDVDLVLLDLNMPKCSGADMLVRIREMCPSALVLMCSGFDDPEVVRSLEERGAVGLVQKPFSVTVLANRVRAALDSGHGREGGRGTQGG